MKLRTRSLLLILVTLLLVLAGGYWYSHSRRVDVMRELRGTQLRMAEHLLKHDSRWPQPGDADASTWWQDGNTARMTGTFKVAQFDPIPNIAFFDSTKPWLTYTAKDGRRYEVLPDGRIDVTQP